MLVLSMAAEVSGNKAVLCVIIQPLTWNFLYLAAYTGKLSQDLTLTAASHPTLSFPCHCQHTTDKAGAGRASSGAGICWRL